MSWEWTDFRVQPLDVEFLLRSQGLGSLALVEDLLQVAVTDGVEHQAVLLAQDLLLALIGETCARSLLSIRSRAFANAASAHEDLGLQQHLAFARLALHVIDGVVVLDVGIEAKNHDQRSLNGDSFQ